MRAIAAAIATFGVLGIMAVGTPAQAHDDDYDGGWRRHEWLEHQWREQRRAEHDWWEHEWRERAYAPPPVAYAPPGYYAPPPAYYAPAPAYYAARPPIYYAPPSSPPVYERPGFSIGFSLR